MNVFILTEGGKDIGLGHITRCTSIYQAFEEIGVLPEFIINGDESVRDLLKDKNSRVFDWLDDRERLFAAVRNADIVFIDSYLAEFDLYEKISNLAKKCVYFDDNIRIDYPKGFVVNGAIFAEQTPYPKINDVVYLLGAQYTPLRKEFWDVPVKPIRDNIETIMITFGGSDIHNLTPKVLKLLTDAYPKILKKVIIGKGFRNTSEIEAIKDHNTELTYYPDATGMKKVMLESDIAISASGQTLYELGRIGVPTIVIIVVPVSDNLMKSFKGMEKSGLMEYAGDWKDDGLMEKIKKHVEKLSCRNLRQSKSSKLRGIFDGKSTQRLIDQLSMPMGTRKK